MANELQTTLDNILEDKNTNLKPENLKQGITVMGVAGTLKNLDTSDATATSNDILYPKTAYVNGQKITGGIEATYIQQLQDVSMQSITVDSAIRIVCVCKTNNVIFTCNATGDITTFYARKFVDNAILEELDSYVIDTGEIYSVSCNDVLNKNGNLSIFFVTRVTSEYCNVYAIEFDLTSGKFKTDTLATLPLLNNSKSWFPYIIVNPLEPDIALTFSMDRRNNYIRTFVYENNILTGSNIITTNDVVARFVEWGTDGKYIISKGYMDTGGNVYIYNYNNNELTLTFNNTYTSPICLYQEGYFITDNKLYTQQGQVVKEYIDLGITNQDYCYIYKNLLFIIRNYSSESDRLDIYCINNDYTLSSVFTQDINWTMNRYFTTVENNDAIGTPYCPVSNTTTLLLSQNGQGYNLSVIPSDNVLLSLKIGNKNYTDVSSAIINDTDVLEGKQFFASISSKRVGTMSDNGELNYTPNTTQQTIPAGYTSGGTIAGDSNLIPENIKKDVSIFNVIGTMSGDTATYNYETTDYTISHIDSTDAARYIDVLQDYALVEFTGPRIDLYHKADNIWTLLKNIATNSIIAADEDDDSIYSNTSRIIKIENNIVYIYVGVIDTSGNISGYIFTYNINTQELDKHVIEDTTSASVSTTDIMTYNSNYMITGLSEKTVTWYSIDFDNFTVSEINDDYSNRGHTPLKNNVWLSTLYNRSGYIFNPVTGAAQEFGNVNDDGSIAAILFNETKVIKNDGNVYEINVEWQIGNKVGESNYLDVFTNNEKLYCINSKYYRYGDSLYELTVTDTTYTFTLVTTNTNIDRCNNTIYLTTPVGDTAINNFYEFIPGTVITSMIYNGDTWYNHPVYNGATSDKVLSGNYTYDQNHNVVQGTMPNKGDLTVTPSLSDQNFGEGYYSSITVNEVTSAVDSDIKPENIKNGVNILGVVGTLETGIDTSSDNPITASDVASGKEGFVNGEKIIGTLNNGRNAFSVIATNPTQIVPDSGNDDLALMYTNLSNNNIHTRYNGTN